ncbi:acriflavine sensitivity control ACR-2 [Fusarium sp. NRRL 52700]|nr:acriflavine sensitivity control ACR-2 [Fusarium sp. NRRL 52700]
MGSHDSPILPSKRALKSSYPEVFVGLEPSEPTERAYGALRASCDRQAIYPCNLLQRKQLQSTTERYRRYLEDEEKKLFNLDFEEINFHDLENGGKDFRTFMIRNSPSVRNHLHKDGGDPKSRFIFLQAETSRAPLNCSRDSFSHIMSYYQVPPTFIEFVSAFGATHYPTDYHMTGFEFDDTLGVHESNLVNISTLGRSGREHRIQYLLRSVERDFNDDGSRRWNIRQAAVYHSFDLVSGKALWINIKANGLLRDRIMEATGDPAILDLGTQDDLAKSFAATLVIHLILLEWCDEDWRTCIRDCESKVRDILVKAQTSQVVQPHAFNTSARRALGSQRAQSTKLSESEKQQPLVPLGWGRKIRNFVKSLSRYKYRVTQDSDLLGTADNDDHLQKRQFENLKNLDTFSFGELQHLHYMSEQLESYRLVMELNHQALRDIAERYQHLPSQRGFPESLKENCIEDILSFTRRVERIRKNLEIRMTQVNSLLTWLQDGKTLFDDILQYRNVQIGRIFTETSYGQSQKMERIAYKTEKETISMHVITCVTLAFLPAMFAATFFQSGLVEGSGYAMSQSIKYSRVKQRVPVGKVLAAEGKHHLLDEWHGCLDDFLDEQWQFCSWVFPGLEGDKRQLPTRQILPIRYMAPVEAAFKIYEGVNTRQLYSREAEVYTRLKRFNETSITRYYGSFEYPETNKRFIILEYTREGSLLDFFRKTPPDNPSDLELLWERLLLLLNGLYRLHNPDKSDSRTLSGIHNDIQPANILVFREQGTSTYDVYFKLADFGLAETIITNGDEGVLVAIDNEGNRMYSAPESYSNYEIMSELRPHVNPIADLWSLGAVYSDFLAWSIGGVDRQERYRKKRQDAIAKLTHITAAGFDACFHNGRSILPAVTDFHAEVLEDRVHEDFISPCMSKLILEYMLVEAPRRLVPMQVKAQANYIIDTAKSGPMTKRPTTPVIAPNIIHPILVIDDYESMREHKRNVKETAKVISYSVKVCDKDGMDLFFASDSCNPRKCQSSSDVEAKIKNKETVSGRCDMKKSLGDVMDHVKANGMKPTGIYIFTDGIWDPDREPEVKDVIHESVKLLIEKGAKPADLMFQFIQFGRDPEGSKRLKFLDDGCKRMHKGVEYDIVDTKHCDDHVPKIIIGIRLLLPPCVYAQRKSAWVRSAQTQMDVTTVGEKDSAVTDQFPLVASAYHWARNVLVANGLCPQLVAIDLPGHNPFPNLLPMGFCSPVLQYTMITAAALHMSNVLMPDTDKSPVVPNYVSNWDPSRRVMLDALAAKQKALYLLRMAFQDLETHGRDMVLTAAMLLVTADMIDSGKHGSKAHLDGIGWLLSYAQPATSVGEMLKDFVISDCYIFYVFALTFMDQIPQSSLALNTTIASSAIHYAARNSFICCPAEILQILWSTAIILQRQSVNNHDLDGTTAKGLELFMDAMTFNVESWSQDIQQVPLGRQVTDVSSRIHTGYTHQMACCLYIMYAIPSVRSFLPDNTEQDLEKGLIFHLRHITDEDPNFKTSFWPTFIAGAQSRDLEQQAWIMDRMKRQSRLFPWGVLYTAMETLELIWRQRANAPDGLNWLEILRSPEVSFLIV